MNKKYIYGIAFGLSLLTVFTFQNCQKQNGANVSSLSSENTEDSTDQNNQNQNSSQSVSGQASVSYYKMTETPDYQFAQNKSFIDQSSSVATEARTKYNTYVNSVLNHCVAEAKKSNVNIFDPNKKAVRVSFLACLDKDKETPNTLSLGFGAPIQIVKDSPNTSGLHQILVIASIRPTAWKISLAKYSRIYFLSSYPQKVIDTSDNKDKSDLPKIVIKGSLDQDVISHELANSLGAFSRALTNSEVNKISEELFMNSTLEGLKYIDSPQQAVTNVEKSKILRDIRVGQLTFIKGSGSNPAKLQRVEIIPSTDPKFENKCVEGAEGVSFESEKTRCLVTSSISTNLAPIEFLNYKNRLIFNQTHLMLQKVFLRDVFRSASLTSDELKRIGYSGLILIDNNNGRQDTNFSE